MKLNIYSSINSMNKKDWDICNRNGNVFTSYNFLKLLEDSRSLSEQSGWNPSYFCWKKKDSIEACLPAYIKFNSQGEFVFDYAWANVYEKLGIKYYPKLIIASPFTPISGKRLLIKNDYSQQTINTFIEDITGIWWPWSTVN